MPALLPLIRETAGERRVVVLIDGGSGSGKSSLARAIHASLPGSQLVRLDDFYPGWHGLEAASAAVSSDVLRSVDPGWTRWDWELDTAAEFHPLDPAASIIVEGSGSLSRINRELATFAIWVQLDETTRKRRALDRDGEAYAPFWDIWAAQERAFFEREHPELLANIVLYENPA